MHALLTVAWLVSVAYASVPLFWLAIHPFAAFWRRQRRPYVYLSPIWGVSIAALALATRPWHAVQLYRTWWALLPALPLFAIGASVYVRIGQFGMHTFTGRAEVEDSSAAQKLVITGMHARVRHPIYLAHVCMLLGWAVASGLAVVYALLLFALLTGALMVRTEERELERRFGDEYREYKSRVPAVLPF